MRESFTIFRTALGPDDKNTKEAEHWLEQLTHNAVSIAKQAKDLQARRARAGYKFASRGVSVGASAATGGVAGGVAAGSAELAGKPNPPPSMDGKTIDELVRYIEGTDKKKKTTGGAGGKKRGGKANPKRRGGAAASASA
jgi:protein TIF31